MNGQIAQLVEQGIENPRVGGSIPSLATTRSLRFLFLLFAMGCGDACDTLCADVADALEGECADFTWSQVDATSRLDFLNTCRDDWEEVSGQLTTRELEVSRDACGDASTTLESVDCETLTEWYGLGDTGQS